MKQGEIQNYRNIGTIQMSKDEEGKTFYLYTHNFFNETYDDNTIKAAKEMLDYYDEKALNIRQAIYTLRGTGYKVFKELA